MNKSKVRNSLRALGIFIALATSSVNAGVIESRINPFQYSALTQALKIVSASSPLEPGARAELVSPILFVVRSDHFLEEVVPGNAAGVRLKNSPVSTGAKMDDGKFVEGLVAKLSGNVSIDELMPLEATGRLFVLVVFPSGMGCAPCDEIRSMLSARVKAHPEDRALLVEFDMAAAAGL